MLAICLRSRTSRMCEEEPFSPGDLSAKGLAEDIQVSFDGKCIPRIALHCFGREPLRILDKTRGYFAVGKRISNTCKYIGSIYLSLCRFLSSPPFGSGN